MKLINTLFAGILLCAVILTGCGANTEQGTKAAETTAAQETVTDEAETASETETTESETETETEPETEDEHTLLLQAAYSAYLNVLNEREENIRKSAETLGDGLIAFSDLTDDDIPEMIVNELTPEADQEVFSGPFPADVIVYSYMNNEVTPILQIEGFHPGRAKGLLLFKTAGSDNLFLYHGLIAPGATFGPSIAEYEFTGDSMTYKKQFMMNVESNVANPDIPGGYKWVYAMVENGSYTEMSEEEAFAYYNELIGNISDVFMGVLDDEGKMVTDTFHPADFPAPIIEELSSMSFDEAIEFLNN